MLYSQHYNMFHCSNVQKPVFHKLSITNQMNVTSVIILSFMLRLITDCYQSKNHYGKNQTCINCTTVFDLIRCFLHRINIINIVIYTGIFNIDTYHKVQLLSKMIWNRSIVATSNIDSTNSLKGIYSLLQKVNSENSLFIELLFSCVILFCSEKSVRRHLQMFWQNDLFLDLV